MNNTDRILIGAMMLILVIMCLMAFSQGSLNRKRLDAFEIRLQNIEHLFSVFVSEPRSPAIVGLTNELSAPANAPR